MIDSVTSSTNPNDLLREQILQYFYDRNRKPTSRFGKKGSAVKISHAKREMKDLYGLSQQEVMSNLTYLIDKNWIKTVEVEKTVRVAGGTVPSVVTWYEITADGIDKIEGESEFANANRYAGINITASGANVINLGDGNVVQASYADLHRYLDDLKSAVSSSESLSESEKLEVAADIETLKDQLVKARPDKTVAQRVWGSITNAVTAAEFVDYTSRIAPLIASIAS